MRRDSPVRPVKFVGWQVSNPGVAKTPRRAGLWGKITAAGLVCSAVFGDPKVTSVESGVRLGVITFSYAGFTHFERMLADEGHYTVNLGDNAQTIAARRLLARLGVASGDIVDIDRDAISAYSGPPAAVLMNAVFRAKSFPIPASIKPIFLGFMADAKTLQANADYLRMHQPIGCRDAATAQVLLSLGVEAFVSGCVTLTLEPRAGAPADGRTFIVYGDNAGELPAGLLEHAPRDVLRSVQSIYHRVPVFEYPLSLQLQRAMETYESLLMAKLSAEASLVITPLHHVAAPCLAMGIPTLICRRDDDARFSFLKTLTPVYVPADFTRIDWEPAPPDLTSMRDYERRLSQALAALS